MLERVPSQHLDIICILLEEIQLHLKFYVLQTSLRRRDSRINIQFKCNINLGFISIIAKAKPYTYK